jgi:hypothetical protein
VSLEVGLTGSKSDTDNSKDDSKIYTLFEKFSREPINVLCSSLPSDEKNKCIEEYEAKVLTDYYAYVKSGTLKDIERSDLTHFLRDITFINKTLIPVFLPESKSEVLSCREIESKIQPIDAQIRCLESKLKKGELEKLRLKLKIWHDYKIIILERENKFSIEELIRFEASYKLITETLREKYGVTYWGKLSHLWGEFSFLEKEGELVVNGQFGEVKTRTFPLKVNVVVDVTKKNISKFLIKDQNSIPKRLVSPYKSGPFSVSSIAKRILHENAHVQDHIVGMRNWNQFWSYRNSNQFPLIYEYCDVQKSDAYGVWDALKACRSKNLEYFNFFPTVYASRPLEFYTKMVEAWFDDVSGKKSSKPYRCQSTKTEKLWEEMEKNLISTVISEPCSL